jgi:Spy/CpxP family protein refolding chaperone
MNRIALAALGAALLTGATTVASAQNATTEPRAERAERGPGRGARGLFRGIELTAEQKAQVKTVHEKYAAQHKDMRAQMQKLRAEKQRPDSVTMEKWRGVMAQERTEIRALLTPEQQATFDANAKQHPGRGRPRRGR